MIKYIRSGFGVLKFLGNDRLDLINRLSTNDVSTLKKSTVLKTIITNEKGRIVDLITLFCFDEYILSLVSDVYRIKLIEHLERYTVMDDFTCEDLSSSYEVILMFSGDDETIKGYISGNIDKDESFCITDKYIITTKPDDMMNCYMLIYPKSYEDKISETLKGCTELTEKEYEEIRVESGIPSAGKEITDEVNPLECGLKKYISFTKGCYIGQEVIARLDSYDKISRQLVGIKANSSFSADKETKIIKEGHECGYVTSYALSEKYGHIGMGFIKTALFDLSGNYYIRFNQTEIPAEIVHLPFK
ncbi:MAG: hypothetical protein N2510_02745 [Ignavibacteria bacterium]|nr:hypothetical protein [Ignavibacteria bacterium]